MRRVSTLMVLLAITLTGVAVDAVVPARAASGHSGTAGVAARHRLTGVGRTKLIHFQGYVIEVPASWPVYSLGHGSFQCVRLDQHAVYLGRPGADQQCPAHLIGRAATISLEPSGTATQWTSGGDWQQVSVAGGSAGAPAQWGPAGPWAPATPRLSRAQRHEGGLLLIDPRDSQVRVVFPRHGVEITASYGTDAGLAGRILRTMRWVGTGGPSSEYASSGSSAPPGGTLASAGAATSLAGFFGRRHHHRWPMKGFDACHAPSLRVMHKWRRAFAAAAIYIGGPEAACGWGNLSRAWVRAAIHMGWALIPTYVGPQAPCSTFSVRVLPGHAEAMGRAAAQQAVGLARALGIWRHAPIYYDMEWYNSRRSRCRHPVLAFLDGWTRALHHHGYRSGVYSSAGAAPADLGAASTVYGHPLAKPDSIWFGLWDSRANLNGTPYVRNTWWSGHHRIKQFRGGHRRRIGRATLFIDSDVVAGAVYR